MNKFLKLSTTALLLSGLAMSGAAMAGTATPKLKNDSAQVTIGQSVSFNVLANDQVANSTIVGVIAGSAKYGTASCTASGACTYKPNATQAASKKQDSFRYTIVYKNAKGKEFKRSATVSVKLKPAQVSG